MREGESGKRVARMQGFTLVEILVVVMIMAVLATIVGVQVVPRLGEARRSAAISQINVFRQALNLYRLDNGMFPTQQQGLDALVRKPQIEPVPPSFREEGYLETRQIPKDPWGREYVYLTPGRDGSPFEIFSYGADGQPGGEGENAEISSSDL